MPSDQTSPPPFPTYLLPTFSFPFRRRQTSTTSISSVPSLSSSPNSSATTTPSSSLPPSSEYQYHSRPGKEGLQEDPNTRAKIPTQERDRLSRTQPNTLKCITCATDIAFATQIVSKGFTGRHGRAYLVSPPLSLRTPVSTATSKRKLSKPGDLINTKIGRSVNRDLLTGAHVVADVTCAICQTVLGWKYVDAKESGQKYKIGKFILETKRVVGFSIWEDGVAETDEELKEERGEEEEEDEESYSVVVFDSEDEDECEDLFAGTWDPEVARKRRGRRVVTRRDADEVA